MPLTSGQYKAPVYLARLLDTNGDGTGLTDVIGNYAGAEEIFFIQPPISEIYVLHRLIIFYQDVGQMQPETYGNNITLTNGINLRKQDDNNTLINLNDSLPIISNADWARNCFDLTITDRGAGAGNDNFLAARWSFDKAGTPIYLNGAANERFEMTFNDNFSGLVQQRFTVQGFV